MQAPSFESLITPPWPPITAYTDSCSSYSSVVEHLQNDNTSDNETKELEQVAILGYN